MNKKGESFEPYDFKIIKGNKIIYIDAKSTVFEKGMIFFLYFRKINKNL